MADLVQSKFELVHLPGGEQVKHGDVTLEDVEEVEKVMNMNPKSSWFTLSD